MAGITQNDQYGIVGEDVLTETEHDSMGNAAPHHAQSHAIISPDHTDIDPAPATGSHPQWDGTKYVHVTGSSEVHDLTSPTHTDVEISLPIEHGQVLKFNETTGKWNNVSPDETPVSHGTYVDDNEDIYTDDNGDFYVGEI